MPKKKRKTKRKAAKPAEEPYFVGLSDPAELRKHILEPTREVIQFLQSYEEFKKAKEEKTQAILQLKADLKAIRIEINKLKRLLPKSKLKTQKPPKKIKEEIQEEQKLPPEKKTPPKARPKPPLARPPAELLSLEKELGAIEKKLGTISE